jgi:CheY-like chemotaxis protein
MQTIAIIEDAKDNRDLLYYLLRDEYHVLRYGSGEEALRALDGHVPDLVVLDIWLPDMDGIEVLKRLRQSDGLKRVPAIALTAHVMAGDREKYLGAGFNEYVSKPIMNIGEFLRMIARVIAAADAVS